MSVHPSRNPRAAATKTAVGSRSPCGRIRPKKFEHAHETPDHLPRSSRSATTPAAPVAPSKAPKASERAATQALFVHTLAANEPLIRGGVALEVLVDQLQVAQALPAPGGWRQPGTDRHRDEEASGPATPATSRRIHQEREGHDDAPRRRT